jgi:hypothetical protein
VFFFEIDGLGDDGRSLVEDNRVSGVKISGDVGLIFR